MRPPICFICGRRFPPSKGGTVRFSDYEPLPNGMTGHPKGLEWFCGDHYEEAIGLKDLASSEVQERHSGKSGWADRILKLLRPSGK